VENGIDRSPLSIAIRTNDRNCARIDDDGSHTLVSHRTRGNHGIGGGLVPVDVSTPLRPASHRHDPGLGDGKHGRRDALENAFLTIVRVN
jgi:hypothetical protein